MRQDGSEDPGAGDPGRPQHRLVGRLALEGETAIVVGFGDALRVDVDDDKGCPSLAKLAGEHPPDASVAADDDVVF